MICSKRIKNMNYLMQMIGRKRVTSLQLKIILLKLNNEPIGNFFKNTNEININQNPVLENIAPSENTFAENAKDNLKYAIFKIDPNDINNSLYQECLTGTFNCEENKFPLNDANPPPLNNLCVSSSINNSNSPRPLKSNESGCVSSNHQSVVSNKDIEPCDQMATALILKIPDCSDDDQSNKDEQETQNFEENKNLENGQNDNNDQLLHSNRDLVSFQDNEQFEAQSNKQDIPNKEAPAVLGIEPQNEAAPYDLMSEGNKVINNGQEEQLNEEHSIHVIKPVDRNEDKFQDDDKINENTLNDPIIKQEIKIESNNQNLNSIQNNDKITENKEQEEINNLIIQNEESIIQTNTCVNQIKVVPNNNEKADLISIEDVALIHQLLIPACKFSISCCVSSKSHDAFQ